MKNGREVYQNLFNKYKKIGVIKEYTLNEIIKVLKSEFEMVEFDKKEVSDLKKDEFVNFHQIKFCMYTEDKEILKRLCVAYDDVDKPERKLYKSKKEFSRAMMYYKIQKGERINVILEGKNNLITNFTVQGESEYIYNLLLSFRNGIDK